jgi:hypothetical protein
LKKLGLSDEDAYREADMLFKHCIEMEYKIKETRQSRMQAQQQRREQVQYDSDETCPLLRHQG